MTYGQWGEDDWVVSLFDQDFKGFAVDVGAGDGITISNTLLLEKRGWRVLCIEPAPEFMRTLTQLRAEWVLAAAAAESKDGLQPFFTFYQNPLSFSSLVRTPALTENVPGTIWKEHRVPVKTLNEILAQGDYPRVDFLSVDTEGTELDALKGIDLHRWQVKVIVVEVWPHVTDEVTPYLASHGYRLHERVGENNRYLAEGFGP